MVWYRIDNDNWSMDRKKKSAACIAKSIDKQHHITQRSNHSMFPHNDISNSRKKSIETSCTHRTQITNCSICPRCVPSSRSSPKKHNTDAHRERGRDEVYLIKSCGEFSDEFILNFTSFTHQNLNWTRTALCALLIISVNSHIWCTCICAPCRLPLLCFCS